MFKLEMETDNAAFDCGTGRELARILRAVASKVADGETEGKVMDINGNSIGRWEVNSRVKGA